MYEDVFYSGAGKFVSHGEWIHPDRVISTYEIIFVLGGSVHITEDRKTYCLEKNDLLLLEPGRRHFGHQVSSNTSFFWVHFKSDSRWDLLLKQQNIPDAYNLSLLFKQLMHYLTENQSRECLDYLTRLILIECLSVKKRKDANSIMAEIAAWIKANRDLPLNVTGISKRFGYNADYLSRLFKTGYNQSLKAYISDVKMDYIKQLLLTTDLSLTDISVQAGFEDYKYFLKFFKYHEGITPTQFLKAYPKTYINKA